MIRFSLWECNGILAAWFERPPRVCSPGPNGVQAAKVARYFLVVDFFKWKFEIHRSSVAEPEPRGAETFDQNWSRKEVSTLAPGQTKFIYYRYILIHKN